MKTILSLLLLGVLAGCATRSGAEGSDPSPWLEGVARQEPVEPASYPYEPPPAPAYPAEMQVVELREMSGADGIEGTLLPEARTTGRAGFADEVEVDYFHDDQGVWYEGDYYPGACFVPGYWDDLYFEEDGFRVPGGLLLGCSRVYDPGISTNPYRGHHGARDSGYGELRRIPRRQPGEDRDGRGTRTGPAPGHHLPSTRPTPPPPPPATGPAAGSEAPEVPPAKVKQPRSPSSPGRTRPARASSGAGGVKRK